MRCQYSSTTLPVLQRANDTLSGRSDPLSISNDHYTACRPTNSCVEVLGCNVLYKSFCIGHCVRFKVSNKSICNLKSIKIPFFSFEGKSLPDILTSLLSRICDSEVQLSAARCLTYIHRSGTLPPSDNRIVYKTLPCLARLCTDEFKEDIRATSAETLAYLAEVCSGSFRISSLYNAWTHFRSTLSCSG